MTSAEAPAYTRPVRRVVTWGRFLVRAMLLVALVGASPASAQDDARDEAREAFQRGSEAAQEERWADSEREFRHAYDLSHSTSALFNRAVALRALGRHVEARDAFDTLLSDEGALDPAVREQVTHLRGESAARVARIVLDGLDAPGGRQRILLDGEGAADAGPRPLELEVNEGHHTILVEQSGFDSFRWSGDLSAGGRVTVQVSLLAHAAPTNSVVVVERVREPEVPAGPSVLEEPWFWILVGLVVLGAAAGTITGLMLDAQLRGESLVVFTL